MSIKQQKLEAISRKVAACKKCPLYKGTTHAVPGAGNANAEIMFIGEAPGFHEDQQGLPFVGAAGKLLDKSLAAINLNRQDVFIGNMIKHRPPGNRDPLPQELEACAPFIDDQIQIIKPKIIATLGRFSMTKFIPDAKISRIHGQPRWVNWHNQKLLIMPLYHPAAALRNGQVMSQFTADFQKLKDTLEMINNPQANSFLATKDSQPNSQNNQEQLSLI
jgi:uracil-DNA glycosylase family 4